MPRLAIDNRTGYDTKDLCTFFIKGLRAMKVKQSVRIVVVASPIRSRGCAEIGSRGREGRVIVIALAAPSHYSLRRLARLFEHEVSHKLGSEHRDMDEQTMYSLGGVPAWAKGTKIRYRRRAPRQMT